MKEEILNGVQ